MPYLTTKGYHILGSSHISKSSASSHHPRPVFRATTHGPSFEPLSPPRQPSPQVTTVPYLSGFVISLFSNIAVMSYEISQSKFPIIVDLMPTIIKHGLVENPPFSSMIDPLKSLFRRDATHCHLIAGGQRYCINSKTGSNICRRVAFLNMADPK